jgi:hypothetical protein
MNIYIIIYIFICIYYTGIVSDSAFALDDNMYDNLSAVDEYSDFNDNGNSVSKNDSKMMKEVSFDSHLKRYNQNDFHSNGYSTDNDYDINNSTYNQDSNESNDFSDTVNNDTQSQEPIHQEDLATRMFNRRKVLWLEIFNRDTGGIQRERRSVLKIELRERIAKEFNIPHALVGVSKKDINGGTLGRIKQEIPPLQKYQKEILAWHTANSSKCSALPLMQSQSHPSDAFNNNIASDSDQPYCSSCFTRTGNKFHNHGVLGKPKCHHGRAARVKPSIPSTLALEPQATYPCVTAFIDTNDESIEKDNSMDNRMYKNSSDDDMYNAVRQEIELQQEQQHKQRLAWQQKYEQEIELQQEQQRKVLLIWQQQHEPLLAGHNANSSNVSTLLPAQIPLKLINLSNNNIASDSDQPYCSSCFTRTGNKFHNHGVLGKPKCQHTGDSKVKPSTPPIPLSESVIWKRSESMMEKVGSPIPSNDLPPEKKPLPEKKPCYNILKDGYCLKGKKCEFSHDKDFLDIVRPCLSILNGQIIANSYRWKKLSTIESPLNNEVLYSDAESNDRHRIIFENLSTMRETSLDEENAEKIFSRKLANSNLPHCPSCVIRTGKKYHHGVPGRPPCNHPNGELHRFKHEFSDNSLPEKKPCYSIIKTGTCLQGKKCEFSHDKDFLEKVRPHLTIVNGKIIANTYALAIVNLPTDLKNCSSHSLDNSESTATSFTIPTLPRLKEAGPPIALPITSIASPSKENVKTLIPELILESNIENDHGGSHISDDFRRAASPEVVALIAPVTTILVGEITPMPSLSVIPEMKFFNDVDLPIPLVVPPSTVPPTIESPLNHRKADDLMNNNILSSDSERNDKRRIIRGNLRIYLEKKEKEIREKTPEVLRGKEAEKVQDEKWIYTIDELTRINLFSPMTDKPIYPCYNTITTDTCSMPGYTYSYNEDDFYAGHASQESALDNSKYGSGPTQNNTESEIISIAAIDEVTGINPINESAALDVSPLEDDTISKTSDHTSDNEGILALPSIVEYHQDTSICNKTDSEIHLPDIYQGSHAESNPLSQETIPFSTNSVPWVLSQLSTSKIGNNELESNMATNLKNVTRDSLNDKTFVLCEIKNPLYNQEKRNEDTNTGKQE